jgi:hypothetical protein
MGFALLNPYSAPLQSGCKITRVSRLLVNESNNDSAIFFTSTLLLAKAL